jgi:uncharacterized protein YjeT (DUF2065 family)
MRHHAFTTIILARILGPVLLLSGAAIAARPEIFLYIIDTFQADAASPSRWGFVALAIGLVILALNHRFNGTMEIVITLIGVLSLVRGLVLLLAPDQAMTLARSVAETTPIAVRATGAVVALLGLWLSLAGFRARAN